MAFLTLTDAFDFDAGVDKTALLAHLAHRLRELKPSDVQISGDSVSFRGGLFRLVSNWNILIPFGQGRLTVDDKIHEVRYFLNVRQLVVAGSLMIGIAWNDTHYDPIVLVFFGLGWLFLVGGNLMISVPRFKQFLRDAIDSTPSPRLL